MERSDIYLGTVLRTRYGQLTVERDQNAANAFLRLKSASAINARYVISIENSKASQANFLHLATRTYPVALSQLARFGAEGRFGRS